MAGRFTSARWLFVGLLLVSMAGAEDSAGYRLEVSFEAKAPGGQLLAGQPLEGNVFIRVVPATGIRHIDFYLDDPSMKRAPHRRDASAPFDLAGGPPSKPKPFVIENLAPGPHTITAKVRLKNGASVLIGGTFQREPADPHSLLVRTSLEDSDPAPLDGRTVNGLIYVTLAPPEGVDSVTFHLDDPQRLRAPYRIESNAPFDLAGGSATQPNALDTGKLSLGRHVVTASVLLRNRQKQVISAEFTVVPVPPHVVDVRLTVSAPSLYVGESTIAQVTATLSDGTSADLSDRATFTGDGAHLVQVSAEIPRAVTALASGVCRLRAAVDGVSSNEVSLDISVAPPPPPPPPPPGGGAEVALCVRSVVGDALSPLDGATVAGRILVTLEPPEAIDGVRFHLDDPGMSRAPHRTESNPPFDFNGGTSTVPTPWDTGDVADGAHQITAVVDLATGADVTLTAEFHIQNQAAALRFDRSSVSCNRRADDPGTDTATVSLAVTNGASASYVLHVDGVPWMSVSNPTGSLPASIDIAVDSSGMPLGIHSATIRAETSGYAPALLVVTLVVSPSAHDVATSVTRHGITWTFDGEYEVGQFANGDWYVVGPVTIQSVSPAWTGSRNGSMVNPRYGGDHGYDSRWDFKASLRVSTNDLVLEPGDSLVSTVGWVLGEAGCPSTNNTLEIPRPTLKSAAVLTVVAQAPPAGSFRPPYGGNDKPLYNVDDLRAELLPRLGRVDSTPTMASVEKLFERLWLDHTEKWTNRYMHPSENMKDYCRDLASQFNTGSLMLMLDFTDAEKRTLMIRLVQIGIDMHAILKTGATYGDGGGGVGSGRKWPILLAGLLLDDQEMMDIGFDYDDIHSLEDCQTFYLTAADASKYPGKPLGHPVWGERHCYAPSYYSDPGNIAYRTCCTANAWVGAVLSAHIMGAKDLWNHDPLFDYQDWYMGDEDRGDWKRSWSDFQEEMWDTYRADYGDVWGE